MIYGIDDGLDVSISFRNGQKPLKEGQLYWLQRYEDRFRWGKVIVWFGVIKIGWDSKIKSVGGKKKDKSVQKIEMPWY